MAIYNKNGSVILAAYDVIGQELTRAYNNAGNIVFEKRDYSSYTKTAYCTVSLSDIQGFDIYNETIFQFRTPSSSGNIMTTVNAANGTIIANSINAVSDHGDSATFSNEFYESGDVYPLMYVAADTNPAKVYINRVTQTTSQLVKTLSFPIDKTGYYAALCFDIDNNIGYMVGYSEQNYQTDDGGANKTVISKWNFADLTANQDGSFTPAFISKIERPFIYIMQGQQFHDGMLWIASGGSNYNGYIYALDPSDGTLMYTINTETTVEVEGLAFISNSEMVVGHQGGAYYKYTFA